MSRRQESKDVRSVAALLVSGDRNSALQSVAAKNDASPQVRGNARRTFFMSLVSPRSLAQASKSGLARKLQHERGGRPRRQETRGGRDRKSCADRRTLDFDVKLPMLLLLVVIIVNAPIGPFLSIHPHEHVSNRVVPMSCHQGRQQCAAASRQGMRLWNSLQGQRKGILTHRPRFRRNTAGQTRASLETKGARSSA